MGKNRSRNKNRDPEEDLYLEDSTTPYNDPHSFNETMSPSKVEKKKKKKIKHESRTEEIGDVDMSPSYDHPSLNDLMSPELEKRKKHKEKHREAAETDFSPSRGLNTSDDMTSPAKKLKIEKLGAVDSNATSWTEAEDKQLLDRCLELLRREKHSLHYKTQLGKLNFEKLAITNRSTKENEERLNLLIEKTYKIKSLQQIVRETLENYDNNKDKYKPKSGFAVFMKQNKEMIKSAVSKGEGNWVSCCSRMWRELPAIQKKQYDNSASFNIESKKKSRNVLNVVKAPVDFYLEKLKKKDESVQYIKARRAYTTLDISKKLKYIRKSIETIKDEYEQIERYATENDCERPESAFKCPNRKELEHYLRSIRMPDMPHKSVYLYYIKEKNIEHDEKTVNLFAAQKLFRELKPKKQDYWINRHKEEVANYNTKLKEWKAEQHPAVIEIFKKVFYPKLSKEGGGAKKTAELRSKHGLKEIEMPVTNATFPGEPKYPPVSAQALYVSKVPKGNSKIDAATARKMFNDLDAEKKGELEEVAATIKQQFINRIKAFVQEMPDEQKKMYLGVRRKKLRNLLKEDIFEGEYPCEDYPIYISMKSKSAKEIDSNESEWHLDTNNLDRSLREYKINHSSKLESLKRKISESSSPEFKSKKRANVRTEERTPDRTANEEQGQSVVQILSPAEKKHSNKSNNKDRRLISNTVTTKQVHSNSSPLKPFNVKISDTSASSDESSEDDEEELAAAWHKPTTKAKQRSSSESEESDSGSS